MKCWPSDQRGALYPAEHNFGHRYTADGNLREFYHSLDPTNTFNPGIGRTSKRKGWVEPHETEISTTAPGRPRVQSFRAGRGAKSAPRARSGAESNKAEIAEQPVAVFGQGGCLMTGWSAWKVPPKA